MGIVMFMKVMAVVIALMFVMAAIVAVISTMISWTAKRLWYRLRRKPATIRPHGRT
jgi:hypothetical protein